MKTMVRCRYPAALGLPLAAASLLSRALPAQGAPTAHPSSARVARFTFGAPGSATTQQGHSSIVVRNAV